MTKKTTQRTLEEALAGVPARKMFVNKTADHVVNPETGWLCAPSRSTRPGTKPHRSNSWFKRIKPDHPEYDPELARKHFLMVQASGRKGAKARCSVPRGFRSEDWRQLFTFRFNQARSDVDRLTNEAIIDLPDDIDDATAAKEALAFNIAVVRSREMTMRNRLTAASKVLAYTRPRPACQVDDRIGAAEAFLAQLAED